MDAGHFHKGVPMPEIDTKFLFTVALEIEVSSLGETPYGRRRIPFALHMSANDP